MECDSISTADRNLLRNVFAWFVAIERRGKCDFQCQYFPNFSWSSFITSAVWQCLNVFNFAVMINRNPSRLAIFVYVVINVLIETWMPVLAHGSTAIFKNKCLTLLAMCSPTKWPLCKRSGMTLIEVSQHAYFSYQAFSLSLICHHVYFATWCTSIFIYVE